MLEKIKLLLGLDGNELDEQLELILANTGERLKLLLGGVSEIPEALAYIVVEVAVARFNRIGSEGMSSHSVEGESISFSDDDFAGYKADRYDVPIYFQHITSGAYDPNTGDYGNDTVVETLRYASVMDTRTETMRLIYGEVRQGSRIIHLQNHYTEPFDRIRIGEKVYAVDLRRKLRVKETFVVSEVT